VECLGRVRSVLALCQEVQQQRLLVLGGLLEDLSCCLEEVGLFFGANDGRAAVADGQNAASALAGSPGVLDFARAGAAA
jgi:hypothetical protein